MEAYEQAAALGVDYVELDVRGTADGELVVHHDARAGQVEVADLGYEDLCAAAGYRVPKVGAVMELIAGRAMGHLDLKVAGGEREVVKLALDLLGEGGFVVTTLEDGSVAGIKREFPDVTVALSLGRDRAEFRWSSYVSIRVNELRPLRRARACGADWVAVHQRLAELNVLGVCARSGIPAMVWTVNDDIAMTRLLADERVSVLVTDRPRRALALRSSTL